VSIKISPFRSFSNEGNNLPGEISQPFGKLCHSEEHRGEESRLCTALCQGTRSFTSSEWGKLLGTPVRRFLGWHLVEARCRIEEMVEHKPKSARMMEE
jgi:hypothetical protein